MWSSVKTTALVLHAEPYREADRRYTALTPEQGKITFIARGARKARAKLAAHVEPLTIAQLELVQGRSGTTLINAERKHAFSGLAKNIDHRLLAHLACGFVHAFLLDTYTEERVYQETLDFFHFLERAPHMSESHRAFICGGFLLRLSQALGYDAELFHCVTCQKKIHEEAFEWQARQGGLVCSWCLIKDPQSGRMVHKHTVKMLRFARESAFDDFTKTALSADILAQYCQCVQDFITHHIPGAKQTPFWEML
jgi:DNA repair protein RecO (recombination protein O)